MAAKYPRDVTSPCWSGPGDAASPWVSDVLPSPTLPRWVSGPREQLSSRMGEDGEDGGKIGDDRREDGEDEEDKEDGGGLHK